MALTTQPEAPSQDGVESPPLPREDMAPFEDKLETILNMIGG